MPLWRDISRDHASTVALRSIAWGAIARSSRASVGHRDNRNGGAQRPSRRVDPFRGERPDAIPMEGERRRIARANGPRARTRTAGALFAIVEVAADRSVDRHRDRGLRRVAFFFVQMIRQACRMPLAIRLRK